MCQAQENLSPCGDEDQRVLQPAGSIPAPKSIVFAQSELRDLPRINQETSPASKGFTKPIVSPCPSPSLLLQAVSPALMASPSMPHRGLSSTLHHGFEEERGRRMMVSSFPQHYG